MCQVQGWVTTQRSYSPSYSLLGASFFYYFYSYSIQNNGRLPISHMPKEGQRLSQGHRADQGTNQGPGAVPVTRFPNLGPRSHCSDPKATHQGGRGSWGRCEDRRVWMGRGLLGRGSKGWLWPGRPVGRHVRAAALRTRASPRGTEASRRPAGQVPGAGAPADSTTDGWQETAKAPLTSLRSALRVPSHPDAQAAKVALTRARAAGGGGGAGLQLCCVTARVLAPLRPSSLQGWSRAVDTLRAPGDAPAGWHQHSFALIACLPTRLSWTRLPGGQI